MKVNFVAMPGPEHKLGCDLIPKPVVTKLQLGTHCTIVVGSTDNSQNHTAFAVFSVREADGKRL